MSSVADAGPQLVGVGAIDMGGAPGELVTVGAPTQTVSDGDPFVTGVLLTSLLLIGVGCGESVETRVGVGEPQFSPVEEGVGGAVDDPTSVKRPCVTVTVRGRDNGNVASGEVSVGVDELANGGAVDPALALARAIAAALASA